MKLTKRRWLSLAIAPGLAALAMLGFASQAQAADYIGTCAAYPGAFNGVGNININQASACTITVPISASGNITIKTTSGAINLPAVTSTTGTVTLTSAAALTTTGTLTSHFDAILLGTKVTTTDINAGQGVQVDAISGLIKLGNVNADLNDQVGGNVLLRATGNVGTGNIKINGTNTTGGIEIRANTGAGSALFNIGGGGANGTGTLDVRTGAGGGNANNFIIGGVYVTNGAGGIKVTSAANLLLKASASRSAILLLDAKAGTITLPTGAIDTSGASGFGAGVVALAAQTLTTVNGTSILAKDFSPAGTNHGIVIAATTINVAGATGLSVNADGKGVAGSDGSSYIALLPKGGITLTSTQTLNNMLWTQTLNNNTFGNTGGMTVAGTGALNVSVNGDYSQLSVSGYPINFNNKAVTLSAKGAISHNIVVQSTRPFTGANGLTFGGTGAVTIDSSGLASGNSAGNISVLVDQLTVSSFVPSFTIRADGNGTGSGGIVNVQPTSVVGIGAPTNISANGPFGNVNFSPFSAGSQGPSNISTTTFNLTANAPAAGGNAGTIFFGSSVTTLGSTTKAVFSANGPTSGTGNGGNITVFPGNVSGGVLKLGTNPGNLQVLANAGSTGGNGGSINVNPFPGSITIDSANAVRAEASTSASANSKGGTVTLIGNPNVIVSAAATGATINVDGKGTSDAGTIKILGNGVLRLGNTLGTLGLSAKATGSGKGGKIEVGYATTLTVDGTISVAGGTTNAAATSSGGIIDFHNNGTVTVGSAIFDATGFGDGWGGSIRVDGANKIDFSQSQIKATAGINGSGHGGTFIALSAAQFDVNQIVKVDSGSATPITVEDGEIQLNGIVCGQRKLGTSSSITWLASYWNCSNPLTPTLSEELPAAIADGLTNLKTKMGNNPVRLYVFDNQSAFQAFFNQTPLTPAYGYTIYLGPSSNKIYSSVFKINGGTLSDDNLQEVAAHELGHAINVINGLDTLNSDFVKYAENDFKNLDYLIVGSDDGTSTRRAACSNNNSAPFDGVVEDGTTNSFICDPTTHTLASKYVGLRNSQIAKSASKIMNWNATFGWVELYPQAFSFRHFVPAGASLYATTSGLLSRGFFRCTNAWADSVLQQQSPLNPTGHCADLVPAWYSTQLHTQP